MSASDKLKALGERHVALVMATPPPGMTFAADYLGPLANLAGDFARALPQIVAVIEAAEHEAAVTDDATTHASLVAALAALDEALS